MAQHTVRRIPLRPRSHTNDKWDDEWLHPALRRVRKVAGWFAQLLTRYAGPALIAGGVFWTTMLLFFHIEMFSLELDLDWYWLLSLSNIRDLAIPLALFIVGLIGLYHRFTRYLTRPAKVGIALAILGLAISFLTTQGQGWFRLDYWLWKLSARDSDFNTTLITLSHYPNPIWNNLAGWYDACRSGLIIFSVGWALFCVAAMMSKVLSRQVAVVLLVTASSIQVPALLSLIPEVRYEIESNIWVTSGLMALLLLPFGTSWVLLGYILPRLFRTQLEPGG